MGRPSRSRHSVIGYLGLRILYTSLNVLILLVVRLINTIANFNIYTVIKVSNLKYGIMIIKMVYPYKSELEINSSVQIKNKQDLYQALTNQEMFDTILEQGLDYILSIKRHSMI